MRVLRLTSPFMAGPDVRAVQRVLKLTPDGEYGPATGSAVAAWKWRMGFPDTAMNTGMGVVAQKIMFRGPKEKLPATYRIRRLARMAKGWRPGKGIATPPPFSAYAALLYGRKFTGLTESPPESNIVPTLSTEGRRLGAKQAAMGYAWCAYFAFLVMLAVGSKSARRGLVDLAFNALYTPTILALAQDAKFGLRIVGQKQAQPGDFVLFNFPGGDPRVDHMGLLDGPINFAAGTFPTLEGNTSPGNSGSQANGGGVWRRTDRTLGQVTAFIRVTE